MSRARPRRDQPVPGLKRVTVVITGLGLTLAACSSGQESTTPPSAAGGASGSTVSGSITIAYLQKQGDQQYFVDQADGAKAAASKLGNVTVQVVNLGTDSNKAISELDGAIARKVNGIIIVVPDQQIGPQVIGKAKSAGIPLMASDDVIKDGSGTAAPFAGFNGTKMGNAVGEEAAKLYKGAGWAPADTRIVAAWKQDLSVCTDRMSGAKDSFTKALGGGEAPKVLEVGTDNSPTDALNKTAAVLTANPGVKHWVVWGCNDENETGSVTALQNAGVKPADIIGVGLGAYLTCKDWKAGQDTGNKASLFISGAEVGAAAVNAMVANLRGGAPLPPETIAKTNMVDKSNWQAAGLKCT